MNYSIFRFTLNMHTHRSQASVSAFYGDTAVRLLISLTDGGVPFLIGDGCTAVLSGTKADGKKLCNRCVIVNGSTIQYDFTEQTSNCVGVTNCEVTLYDAEGKVVTAPKFTLVIDEREVNGDDIPVSETEMNIIAGIAIAETTREEAEASRVEAEEAREYAETARNTAEQTRVSEEKKRVAEFASFKKDWDNYNIEVSEPAVTEIVKNVATSKEYIDKADAAVNERVTTLADIVKTIDTDPFLMPVKESERAYSRIVPETTLSSKLGSPSQIAHINSISGDTVKPRKNIFTPSSAATLDDVFRLTVSEGGIIHAYYDSLYADDQSDHAEFYFPLTLPPGTWYVNTLFTSKKADGVSAFFFGDSVDYGVTSVTTSKPMECNVAIVIDQSVCDGTEFIEWGEYENGEFVPTGGEEISVCDRYFYVSVSEYPNGVFGEEDNTEGLVHIPVTKVESYNSIVFNPEDLQQGRYRYNGNRELVFSENSNDRSVTAYLTEGTYTVACYVYNSATDSYTAKPMNLEALVRGLEMDSEFFDYSYSDTFEGTYETHRKSFGTEGYTFDVSEACDVKMSFWDAVDWGKVYIVINRGSEPIPITDHKSNTYEIPAEILTRCPDYGKKYTYIDFDTKEFVTENESGLTRTDISDLLTDYKDFKEIEVYEGGIVTFANTPRLPVESTMSFMQPELEV